jgi:hypothetical protein
MEISRDQQQSGSRMSIIVKNKNKTEKEGKNKEKRTTLQFVNVIKE